MRRLIFAVVLAIFPLLAIAQPSSATDVAHGSEKVAHEAAHAGQGQAEAHEEPKFLGVPAWIFKLLNMVLFIALLGYLIGRPAKGALSDRGNAIRNAAEEARVRREKADRVASDIQARLAQLEEEVRTIRERAEQEGERQKRELIAAAEVEAARILQNARAEVDSRLKHARHELTEYAGELATQRAEQILRERITPDDQANLFKESLSEVGEVRS
jgi:F-type H+-transporting ATPase subunit b